ncbi:MAG: BTAD domain-containing putative transcriptional regulator [Candidatus Promineifilaceae bacterium]
MAKLELSLLGTPLIALDGHPVPDLVSHKAQALLFYLAVTGQSYSRERLAGLLWGDLDEERARGNLRVALTKLRPLLDAHLQVRRYSLAFNRDSSYVLDVARFEENLQRPQPTPAQLAEAVELYRGEFLADFNLRDAPLFDEWAVAQRERLHQMALRALYFLAQYHTQQREYQAGIKYLNRLLALEPWLEEAHRELMRLFALTRQRSMALIQYDVCRQMLAEELSIEPAAETTALYAQILAGELQPDADSRLDLPAASAAATASAAAAAPATPVAPAPFQVPRQTPYFVGRQVEQKQLATLLKDEKGPRLAAVVGMGGVGKTTLAVQTAHALREHFVDGVLWANAAASDPLAIMESWAQAYGADLSRYPDRDSRAAALRGLLAHKRALIVLDDVRATHVDCLFPGDGPCAVLLTTRNLEVARALVSHVLPLGVLPPANGYQLLARILGEKRVLQEADAAAEICALLHQLPLAVEIAAQRLASRSRQSLVSMAARLRDAGNRLGLQIIDRPVRASFAVSWDTLEGTLRTTFAGLSLFGGRAFTAAAVAALMNVNQDTAEDYLFSLAAFSLIAEEGADRFRLHPLLADFAQEKFQQTDEKQNNILAARLIAHYLALAQAQPRDYTALQSEWENLLAAVRLAHQQGLWLQTLALCEALTPAWFARGRFYEARQAYHWASAAAAQQPDEAAAARIWLQWGQACLRQGDYREAQTYLERSYALFVASGDQRGASTARYELADIAQEQGNLPQARAWVQETLAIWQQASAETPELAALLYKLADIDYGEGRHQIARQEAQQALVICEKLGDRPWGIKALRLLATIAITLKEYDEAETHCRRALAWCEESGDQSASAFILYNLATIHQRRGQDLPQARQYAADALTLFEKMGDRRSQAQALYAMSQIDAGLGDYQAALAQAQRSLDLCEALGDLWGQVFLLKQLGDLQHAVQQVELATTLWQRALSLIGEREHPLKTLLLKLSQ